MLVRIRRKLSFIVAMVLVLELAIAGIVGRPQQAVAAANGPLLIAMSPSDNATGVSPSDKLVLTFDENVQRGTGSAAVSIRKVSDNSVAESYEIATSQLVSIGANRSVVTIDPTDSLLVAGEAYYVWVDAGAFRNDNGQNFAGLTNAMSWNFWMRGSNATPPQLMQQVPVSGAVAPIDTALSLKFNEPVFAATGIITIQNITTGNAADTQSISVVSPNVRGSGTDTLTIMTAGALLPNNTYEVLVPGGAFSDGDGNAYVGIGSGQWRFTTSAPPMAYVPQSPADNATNAELSGQLQINFGVNVAVADGNKKISINRVADNATVQQLSVASSSINGATVSIPYGTLAEGTEYYVLIDAGSYKDAASGAVLFQGISSATAWNFRTKPGVDTAPPVVSALSPLNSSVQSTLRFPLTVQFNEAVLPANGSIVIRNTDNNTVFETIPITSSLVTGGGTNVLTINLPAGKSFVNNASYEVQIGNQAIIDRSGNLFAGMSTGQWTFRVTQDSTLPTLASVTPVSGSSTVQTNASFIAVFSEPIALPAATGTVTIKRSGTSTGALATQLSIDPQDNKKLIIKPIAAGAGDALSANTSYYVEMQEGSVTDLAGNRFVGILNEYQWSFRTIGSDGMAPTLMSAEMSSGSWITLKYNEDLDPNSVPSSANYYVTVNDVPRAVVGVKISGATVSIQLQSSVVFGQVVKVSYSKGTTPVQDISRNASTSFTGYTVTNTSDTTQPRPLSGTVNGNTLTLQFSEDLAAISSYAYYQFQVKVNGSSYGIVSAMGGGSYVILTLSGTVPNGQSVSVSYTASSYPLKDSAGNAVQSFTDFYIRNGVDTKAPALMSAAASGNKLTLTYDEGLDRSSVPSSSQFSVLVAGTTRPVQSVEVNNNQVILTLSVAVGSTQGVIVSYVSGTPALKDLAGNAAPTFGGVTANIVNGSTQVTGASVTGATVTLSFNEVLNSSYVPLITQFSVKVNNIVRPLLQASISNNSVVLTLTSPVTLGDVVSLSYSSTNALLRTMSGTLIGDISSVSVTNLTTNGQTGGTTTDGNVVLKPLDATATSDLSPGGRSAQRYTLTADKVTAAFNTARTSSSKLPRVTFEVPPTEGAALVAVPISALEAAKSSAANASFMVRYGDLTYEVPLSSIDWVELRKVGGTSGSLLFTMDKGAGSQSSAMQTALATSKAQLIVGPLSYELFVVNGSATNSVKQFSGYLTRTVHTTTKLDPRQTAAVWLDPETGVLSYVPTTVAQDTTGSTITFKRKGNSAYAIVKGGIEFTDTSKHWAYSDIMLLANKYIVEGRSTTKFEPTKPVTRGEFAMFISRGLGLSGDKASAAKFKDVNQNATLASYIGAATKAGIVLGNSDGTFKPNSYISRQEMAVMLMRAASAADVRVDLPQTASTYLNKFKDKSKIGTWAQQDVAKAVFAQLINGQTSTTFAPQANATRAEAVIMIKRLLVYIDFIEA
ncbi:outer membrane protein [Paenibacillus curdlanolyticus YK9]|uniref:Outer membrane protein n=1 Tax=Paenibacillus curdlanolyticus YK9 TaxID=717606 RepID=E0IEE7_9BACL|nr:Ig-like domain-containing protein [Paenibacillus curdlanolyticus]EFM09035.1 outer membrane protein [Paenibacillus curdlanolyticus YK9]